MEKMQKCTQENLQQLLQSAEQRPERLKAALNIIEHSDNTEEQKIKLLKMRLQKHTETGSQAARQKHQDP